MIFFLGPLPPPLHGFSNINLQMLKRLQNAGSVRVFNTAAPLRENKSWRSKLDRLHRIRLMLSFTLLCLVHRPNALYLGLSGGLGQIADSAFLVIARLTGAEIFVHHHSFAYLNNVSPHNRICLWLVKQSRHIVLCEKMAVMLASLYRIEKNRILVLSNAAFLDDMPEKNNVSNSQERVLTLGFLSNITLEKGIDEFFMVIRRLRERGIPIKGIIAGPVALDIQGRFSEMLSCYPEVEYVGPVYGVEKEQFFETINFLLFPTKYKNEAEPVTIIEALRFGVPVLASGQGCIYTMIDHDCGKVFLDAEQFVTGATEYIESVQNRDISLKYLSARAFKQFGKMRSYNLARLDSLLAEISNRGTIESSL